MQTHGVVPNRGFLGPSCRKLRVKPFPRTSEVRNFLENLQDQVSKQALKADEVRAKKLDPDQTRLFSQEELWKLPGCLTMNRRHEKEITESTEKKCLYQIMTSLTCMNTHCSNNFSMSPVA